MNHRAIRHGGGRARRGSAFILALMVLAILTVIGLSVSLITETEMSIGETEKIQNDQFFAGEAGAMTAIAGLLVTSETKQVNVVIPAEGRERSRASFNVGYDVLTSGLAMIAEGRLGLTKEGDNAYVGRYLITRTLTRRTLWPDDQQVPTCEDIEENQLGSTLVTTAFYFAPSAKNLSGQTLLDTFRIAHKEHDGLSSNSEFCLGGAADGQTVFDFVNVE